MLEVVYAYLRKTRTVTVYGNFGGIPLRAIIVGAEEIGFHFAERFVVEKKEVFIIRQNAFKGYGPSLRSHPEVNSMSS